MRFLFWTLLDILKMSIFGFLKIIFFYRTEKSENKNDWNCRSENGKENIIGVLELLRIFKNDPPLKMDIFERMEQMLASVPFIRFFLK